MRNFFFLFDINTNRIKSDNYNEVEVVQINHNLSHVESVRHCIDYVFKIDKHIESDIVDVDLGQYFSVDWIQAAVSQHTRKLYYYQQIAVEISEFKKKVRVVYPVTHSKRFFFLLTFHR